MSQLTQQWVTYHASRHTNMWICDRHVRSTVEAVSESWDIMRLYPRNTQGAASGVSLAALPVVQFPLQHNLAAKLQGTKLVCMGVTMAMCTIQFVELGFCPEVDSWGLELRTGDIRHTCIDHTHVLHSGSNQKIKYQVTRLSMLHSASWHWEIHTACKIKDTTSILIPTQPRIILPSLHEIHYIASLLCAF